MKSIHLSKDLSFPAEDALESVFGVTGKRGGGKTGWTKRAAEEFYRVGLPFIILDPVGIHRGIRSSFDGKQPSGLKVLIVGGAGGDIPLDPRAGEEVAKAICEANVSAVIDLSEASKTDWRRFVSDFADGLFRFNKTSRHIFLEEATEFAPQKPQGREMQRSAAAVEKLVKMGRNKGLGATLVTQRPATLNKDVLTQLDSLVCFGLLSPQDRKAVREWVLARAEPERLKLFEEGLAQLEPREAWVWSPVEFKIFKRVKVLPFNTLHLDVTHLRRLGLKAAKPLTTDVTEVVQRLGGVMQKLAEQKKEQASIPELQRRIRGLEAKLATRTTRGADVTSTQVQASLREGRKQFKEQHTVWAAAVAKAERDLQNLDAVLRTFSKNIEERVTKVQNDLTKSRFDSDHVRPIPEYQVRVVDASPRAHETALRRTDDEFGVPVVDSDGIGNPHKKVLKAIAELHAVGFYNPTRAQVAHWAGYKMSGSFRNYLGRVSGAGLVVSEGGNVHLTSSGYSVAGVEPGRQMDKSAVRERVQEVVGHSRWKLLNVLIEAFPSEMSRDELAQAAGYEMSGSFRNYLGWLSSLRVIESRSRGRVLASPLLFEDHARGVLVIRRSRFVQDHARGG